MSDSFEDAAPTLLEMERLTVLAKFVLDAKACAKRLEEVTAMTIAANEAEAAARRAETALAARVAELDARSAALDTREAALEAVEKRWRGRMATVEARERHLSDDGQRAWLLEKIEEARGRDERTRRHVMRIARLDSHYNEALQSFPSWDAIVQAITPGDAHFDATPDTDATSAEPLYDPLQAPESLPAGVNLTRSPRRGAAPRH